MKTAKKIILSIFNAIIGAVAFLIIVGLIILMTAYSSGFMEEKMPSLYCWFSGPKTKTVTVGDTAIYKIRYKQDCTCDTTIYFRENP